MPRVLPSQAVATMERLFNFLADPKADPHLPVDNAASLSAIVEVIDQLPPELVTLDGADFANMIVQQARIKAYVQEALTRGSTAMRFHGRHLRELRDLLVKCPDHAIPQTVTTLAFVANQELREALRADIASVEVSIKEADWKAATVIAGSVVEAILLDAILQEQVADIATAIAALVAKGKFHQRDIPDAKAPEWWNLHQFTEVAEERGIIGGPTAAQVRIAREFRNLIHPGRALRLAQQCDRGTAFAATAALEFVVRDLSSP